MKIEIIYDKFRYEPAQSLAFDWFFKHAWPEGHTYSLREHTDTRQIEADRVLLLGQKALRQWTPFENLLLIRGYPLSVESYGRILPGIATFHPQEAYDWRFDEDIEKAPQDNKDFAITHPQNWRFWIKVDTLKVTEAVKNDDPLNAQIRPALRPLVSALERVAGKNIFLDIETTYSGQLSCIGFAVEKSPVYVVPIYLYNNVIAYDQLLICKFLRALAKAFSRNRVIVHNAMFDLLILAWKYRIPFGNDIYDTMLAQHRLYPEAEKSLAHAISMWTWQPFHKDTGGQPYNSFQQQRFWEYNARDVHCMRLIYHAQPRTESVCQVMENIPIYLRMTLRGIKVHEYRLAARKWQLMRQLEQLTRICRILVGSNFNPGSNKQCCDFFHGKLHYKVQKRTDTGAPSLNQEALYKLRLMYDNPLIDVILQHRALTKELSMINFHAL